MTALAWWLLLVPLVPGALALVALVLSHRSAAGVLAIAGALPAVVVGLLLPTGMVDYPWLFLGTRLGMSQAGALFLSFTALTALAVGLFASLPYSPLEWAQVIAQRQFAP